MDPRVENARAMASSKETEIEARNKARRETTTVAEVWYFYLEHHQKRWSSRHLSDHKNLSQAGGSRKKRGDGLTVQGVLWPLLEMRMVDINAKDLAEWQAREATRDRRLSEEARAQMKREIEERVHELTLLGIE